MLFCEAAAVPVAVYEGTYGRNLLFSRPLQALEKTIPTAESFRPGIRIQTARKAETRATRIQKFVDMLAKGEKLYP